MYVCLFCLFFLSDVVSSTFSVTRLWRSALVPCACSGFSVSLFSLDSAFLSGVSVSPTCYFELPPSHPSTGRVGGGGLPVLQWETVYIIHPVPSPPPLPSPHIHSPSPVSSPTWNSSYLSVSRLVLPNDTVFLFCLFVFALFLFAFVLFSINKMQLLQNANHLCDLFHKPLIGN